MEKPRFIEDVFNDLKEKYPKMKEVIGMTNRPLNKILDTMIERNITSENLATMMINSETTGKQIDDFLLLNDADGYCMFIEILQALNLDIKIVEKESENGKTKNE